MVTVRLFLINLSVCLLCFLTKISAQPKIPDGCYNELDPQRAAQCEASIEKFFTDNVVLNKSNYGLFQQIIEPFKIRLDFDETFLTLKSLAGLKSKAFREDDNEAKIWYPYFKSYLKNRAYLKKYADLQSMKERMPGFEATISKMGYVDGYFTALKYLIKAQFKYAEQIRINEQLFKKLASHTANYDALSKDKQVELFFKYLNLEVEFTENDLAAIPLDRDDMNVLYNKLFVEKTEPVFENFAFYPSPNTQEGNALAAKGWNYAAVLTTLNNPLLIVRVAYKDNGYKGYFDFKTYFFNQDCSYVIYEPYPIRNVRQASSKAKPELISIDKAKFFIGSPITSIKDTIFTNRVIKKCFGSFK